METAVLAGRVLLAAVFAVAGTAKLRDPRGYRRALVELGVPRRLTAPVSVALPAVEVAVAIALILPPLAVWGAIAALVLLSAFSAAIGHALVQGRRADCGCFGGGRSTPLSRTTLARNGGLALVAVLVAVRGPGPGIGSWVGDRSVGELVIVVAAIAMVGAVWGRAVTRRSAARVSADEAARRRKRPGLEIGATAPGFERREACNGTRTLESLLARRLPLVLVFSDAECSTCRDLYPHLGRWQTTLGNELTIAVVTSGDPKAARPLCQEHGIVNVLVDDAAGRLRRTYRMPRMPSGVAVAPDGTIASAPVRGPDAIEELVRLTLRRRESAEQPWKQPSPVA